MTTSIEDPGTGQPGLRGDKNRLTELPAAIPSLWRMVQLGYRAEPRLLIISFLMTAVAALPDALMALWLALL
ncbi:MAG: hypothetical protein AAFO29_23095, partial [Actinomycetota bacterium]